MLTEEEFISLVDSTPDEVSTLSSDLEQLYEHYGIQIGQSMSSSVIVDHLRAKIAAAFRSDPKEVRRHCQLLQRQVIFRHVLGSAPLFPYLDIAYEIEEIVGLPLATRGERDDWTQAICAASDLLKVSAVNRDLDDFRRDCASDFAVAEAVRHLREQGFQVDIENHTPFVESAGGKALVGKIHDNARRLGGVRLAVLVFSVLKPLFDPTQQRYHLRPPTNLMGEVASPQVPVNYLLQLAARYPFTSSPDLGERETKVIWEELLELTTNLAALYEVQSYNPYDVLFQGPQTIVPFLQKLALYDSLFNISQIRPKDVVRIAQGISDWVDHEETQAGGWTLAEAFNVAEATIRLTLPNRGPIIVTARDVIPLCPAVRRGKIFDILENLYSHKLPGANQNYQLPDDLPDFMCRPFLSDGRGGQWLLDISICAPAFLEAVLAYLRTQHKTADERSGHAIERFVRREFSAHQVPYLEGKYSMKGVEGECDVVVETKDCIIFFEIKKKSLTGRARVGYDTAILLDLAASLVEAQVQAGRHELMLRKHGKLELVSSSGAQTIVSLNSRQVVRVAVTLFDYGSLQDRVVLQHFLTATLAGDFEAIDSTVEKEFRKLKKKILTLRAQFTELCKLDQSWKNTPFFNCWFLSVPQLLVLLDYVNSNSDLKEALWRTRHVTTGSLNFYFDFDRTSQLLTKTVG